ncbi:hypothetical protein [Polymorphum gilvum]|nr:hypothetical protein [Polymorphum gilvum]
MNVLVARSLILNSRRDTRNRLPWLPAGLYRLIRKMWLAAR